MIVPVLDHQPCCRVVPVSIFFICRASPEMSVLARAFTSLSGLSFLVFSSFGGTGALATKNGWCHLATHLANIWQSNLSSKPQQHVESVARQQHVVITCSRLGIYRLIAYMILHLPHYSTEVGCSPSIRCSYSPNPGWWQTQIIITL